MRLPRTISLQVSRKLADKTKDEMMTEVLRVFAGLDVKAVLVAYEVNRVTFASPEHFREAKSFSGNGIFSFYGALSWGAAPLLRACTFSIFLSRRMTDLGGCFRGPWCSQFYQKADFSFQSNPLWWYQACRCCLIWGTGPQVSKLPQQGKVQKSSKRVGEDKGSSAKRSNSAPSPTFSICFTNSQRFNCLVANSAELDGITSKGNNESTAVRNISNEKLNVINDNTSANSTETSNEVIHNSSANSTERVNEVINNSSTERSNKRNESSGGLNEVNAINPRYLVVT